MGTAWLVLLGVLLVGYLTLDGYAFGVGLALWPVGRRTGERRLLLNAVGPYFLGNEVWVVAAAGVLFAGFPRLEGALLAGFYPLVVLVIGALILRDGGMWFRSRHEGRRWRRGWDAVIVAASTALAFGWGLILGNVVQGVPTGHAASAGASLFGPYALLCGVAFTALSACHGAMFAAMRTTGEVSARAARLGRGLLTPAAVMLIAAAGMGLLVIRVRHPLAAVLLAGGAVVVLLFLRLWPGTISYGRALAGTGSTIGLVVLAVSVGQASTLLGLAAAPGTLDVLGPFLLVVLPLMAAGQVWLWWAFRGPLGPESRLYF